MQVIARLVLCLVFLFGCATPNRLSKKKPIHHTENGFKNNYLSEKIMTKSLLDVLRWRVTRKPQEPIEFEKDKRKLKGTSKKPVVDERGAAFHEKKDKNKKVNLGGPSKTKTKKTAPRNRGVEKKRAAKFKNSKK